MELEHAAFKGEHPDHPGWYEWRIPGETRFNQAVMGLTLIRLESGQAARIRMFPQEKHININDVVHGGIIMSLADMSMFAGVSLLLGKDLASAVTVEANVHFLGAGSPENPLDAVVEVVRETGRLVFVRGQVEQGENAVAAFSGIIRKIHKK